MTCSKVQALLSAYLDRELNGIESLAIRDHLRECSCCRREETELRSVKALLMGAPIEGPSPDFEARLCARIRGTVITGAVDTRRSTLQVRVMSWISGPRPVFAMAAVGISAAAVAVGIFYLIPNTFASHASSMTPGGHPGQVAATNPARGHGKPLFEVIDRDHAYISSSDPLSGPQVAMSASYVSSR